MGLSEETISSVPPKAAFVSIFSKTGPEFWLKPNPAKHGAQTSVSGTVWRTVKTKQFTSSATNCFQKQNRYKQLFVRHEFCVECSALQDNTNSSQVLAARIAQILDRGPEEKPDAEYSKERCGRRFSFRCTRLASALALTSASEPPKLFATRDLRLLVLVNMRL